MAAQLGNYVLETATSPGTGGFTLNGAEANRRSFSAAFPNGGNVLYFADDGSQAEWGIGTLTVGTPSTLARSTVLGNTAGTKVALNFPGSVEVYNEIPAELVPVLEQDGSLTLAGGLTVKGKALVQDVDDFTSQEAVPAAQVDGRYVASTVGGGDTGNVQQLTFNTVLKQMSAQTRDGAWHFIQLAGDYATNPALNTETTNRTNADAFLQNQVNYRVQKEGDNVPGVLRLGFGAGWSGGTTSGAARWGNGAPVIGNPDGSGLCQVAIQIADVVNDGSNNGSGLHLQGTDGIGNRVDWYLPWNGNITTPKGLVAFQSDLQSALPFVDKNLRVQVWVLDSCSDGGTVTIPAAFSSTLGVIAQDMTPYSRYPNIEPVKINTDLMSGGQFKVQIWSSSTNRRVLFVAYGYF